MSEQERLYNLLKETFLLLDSGDRQLFAQFDLTLPRYYALYHINEAPGSSLSQLSQRMFCDKSNITRIIKGLEADDLVLRKSHESDGRTLRIFLTDAGSQLLSQVSDAHRSYNEARFDCFQSTEVEALLTLLMQLQNQLHTALEPTS